MAGKFLTPEETARALGIPVEEVTRLVDRKELFPVRDGAAVKYKVDDVERIKARGAEGSGVSGLSLDLDLDAAAPPASGAGSAAVGSAASGLSLGSGLSLDGDQEGESIFPSSEASGADAPSAGGSGPAARSALEDLEIDDLVIGDDVLESPPAAKAPAKSPAKGPAKSASGQSALSAVSGVGSVVGGGGSSLALGSSTDAAASGSMSGAGSALSGVLDSGLSLEDDDAAESGIDVAGFDDAAAEVDGATALGSADDFELTAADEDESGSVVIAAESESGESSFFGTAADESSSAFSSAGDASVAAVAEAGDLGDMAVVRDTTFSVWQICGLVCCALLLLTGGFVMFDLVRTLGSPEDLSLSNPLLTPMADIFGWR